MIYLSGPIHDFTAPASAIVRERDTLFAKMVAVCEELLKWDEQVRDASKLFAMVNKGREQCHDKLASLRTDCDQMEAAYATITGHSMPSPRAGEPT